ncbi:membrane-associated protein, putative [Bodo saltans]|uniref:Membrane-associated protein, putative n=1 Tax=Bodo saltans TaxID=75058 RepID=A0A0S4JJD6_BODSA|nr:membrane-associated protein, putative [Bodo saltans]|eukprot:CUG89125.1 membrane-associated protein, putative [Bodo saltans]
MSQQLSRGTTTLTASRTQSVISLSSFTATIWSTTLSTTVTSDASLTFSFDNASRSITSTYASRSLLPSMTTTHSSHTSWSRTRSKTSSPSISVMTLPSSSMEISQPSHTYPTMTRDTSQEMSRSASPSTTTTASLQLAPCGLRHVDVIRSMVPPLFLLTMILTRFKESSTDVLHNNDNSSITDRLPLILRHEHFSRPVINYGHPSPYQTPNIDGFVNRGGVNVTLRWVNRSALELTLPRIPNYWIDADEDATVDVPFEELQLCNRTDPASVYVPETVPLVSVHVVGPPGDDPAGCAVSVDRCVHQRNAVGDASSSASLQTLVVLGMQSCGQPAVALNPLYAGVDGMVGVVVGNAVLIGAAVVIQLLTVVVWRALTPCRELKRVPSFAQACATLRAPSATISLLFVLYQGTFYASTQVITQEGVDGGDAAIGAVAFCLLLAVPPFLMWWCTTTAAGRDCFRYDYKASTTLPSAFRGVAAAALLPYSRIEPPEVSKRFAALVSPYRTPHAVVPVLSLAIPFGMSLISLWHPNGSVGCRVYFWLVMLMHVGVVAFSVFVRPHRFMHVNLLFTFGTVVNLTLLLCMVAAMESPRFLNTDVAAGVGVAQLAIQCAGIAMKLWSMIVDRCLLGDTPLVFLWSTRKDGGLRFADLDGVPSNGSIDATGIELLEQHHSGQYEEALPLSFSFERLAHSDHSKYLVGDREGVLSDLDDALSRLPIVSNDDDETLWLKRK